MVLKKNTATLQQNSRQEPISSKNSQLFLLLRRCKFLNRINSKQKHHNIKSPPKNWYVQKTCPLTINQHVVLNPPKKTRPTVDFCCLEGKIQLHDGADLAESPLMELRVNNVAGFEFAPLQVKERWSVGQNWRRDGDFPGEFYSTRFRQKTNGGSQPEIFTPNW